MRDALVDGAGGASYPPEAAAAVDGRLARRAAPAREVRSAVRRIGILPQEDRTNGWLPGLPPRQPRPPLTGDMRADWVVLGAGFAGLAASRRLAENRPNDRIVLLDAQAVADGASGRNSGFAIDLPHNVGSSLDELEGSHRHILLSRAAIGHLEQLVTRHRIDCQWRRPGKYHAAVSAGASAGILQPFARELDALGEPYRWVERDALTRELGTPYYHSAVRTPGGVLMNPAALVRGLADSLPGNVVLCEHSPVIAFECRGNGVRLTTVRGSVARRPVSSWRPTGSRSSSASSGGGSSCWPPMPASRVRSMRGSMKRSGTFRIGG